MQGRVKGWNFPGSFQTPRPRLEMNWTTLVKSIIYKVICLPQPLLSQPHVPIKGLKQILWAAEEQHRLDSLLRPDSLIKWAYELKIMRGEDGGERQEPLYLAYYSQWKLAQKSTTYINILGEFKPYEHISRKMRIWKTLILPFPKKRWVLRPCVFVTSLNQEINCQVSWGSLSWRELRVCCLVNQSRGRRRPGTPFISQTSSDQQRGCTRRPLRGSLWADGGVWWRKCILIREGERSVSNLAQIHHLKGSYS